VSIEEQSSDEWTTAIIQCVVSEESRPLRIALFDQDALEEDLSWIKVNSVSNSLDQAIRSYGQVPASLSAKVFQNDVSICLSPFRSSDDQNMLVQWMEFHKLLGVDKVYAYDSAASKILEPALSSYEKEGILQLVAFDLSTCPQGDEKSYCGDEGFDSLEQIAKSAATQDCLMRTVGVSKWTAFSDLNEFIVLKNPRMYDNLPYYLDAITHEMDFDHNEMVGFQLLNVETKACAVSSKLSRVKLEDLSEETRKSATVPLHQARKPLQDQGPSKKIVNSLMVEQMKAQNIHRIPPSGPIQRQKIAALNRRNQKSDKYLQDHGVRAQGRWQREMYHVHAEEAMVFRLEDTDTLKDDSSQECHELYSSGKYVRDATIWKLCGPELMEVVSKKLEIIKSN
jgi:hypothetical protein